ncbi:MAG: arylsulfatase [Pirellulales bacterium]
MNSRIAFPLLRCGLLIAICVGLSSSGFAQQRPNVLVILADDLGYSDLGCYGGEISTPNIDRLAAGGVKLAHLYTSARCCPTRASLMTGLYPTQAGIGDFTLAQSDKSKGPGYLGRLTDKCVTIAEALKPYGYQNYYVGKWHMHSATGPIQRGFDEFYGYMDDHSHDQYDAKYYKRLPADRRAEVVVEDDKYYATDVFNQYAIEFIHQGQKSGKPWFVFLGHSSPHFPIQAPADRVAKYQQLYRRGWDELRRERFDRMQQLGLVNEHWKFTNRSMVPVDDDPVANGFSGQQNPAWVDLDSDRQKDLAQRMAVFAAMVESVDIGVGRIVDQLSKTGQLENTLILFLSDNGACYEWGPFGFDGVSRKGTTTLHRGDDLQKIGGKNTHQSYGSGWANLGNTPFRMYKHFTYEGGLCTPFIAHWPNGIKPSSTWVRDPAHVMDVLPTILDVTGAEYPQTRDSVAIPMSPGISLLPVLRGGSLPLREIGFDHQGAHALREGPWKIVKSKRTTQPAKWELYHMDTDRCETNDLAEAEPERLKEMIAQWDKWARRVGVIWEAAPK